MEDRGKRLRDLEELPSLTEEFLRDLPYLLDQKSLVREYEVVGGECTEASPIYRLTPENIRFLTDEEVKKKVREAEDERAVRYRAMYESLGMRVVAHPDGTMEATWKSGEAALRTQNDTSKNKHARKHFHASGHPIVQSFEPGEDWRWCYIDTTLI